jgi:bifunctional UDP-N-acetylglucosamine pyrophosphorylase/glucosamine-1-phosphate N-acetyltransferase
MEGSEMAATTGSDIRAVVLAGGQGKRMKSGLPKVLHKAAGRPLLVHVLRILESVGATRCVIVASPAVKEYESALKPHFSGELEVVIQDPPRGTGDAAQIGLEALGDGEGTILIMHGDTPLYRPETIESLLELHRGSAPSATMLTARVPDPTGYGRIVRDGDKVVRIIEERDATAEQREIDEINASVYLFDAGRLGSMLQKLDAHNAQGELYLTDVFKLLYDEGDRVLAQSTEYEEAEGVNSRSQLAEATRILRARACEFWMHEGVSILDPKTTYIDPTVKIARDATIFPFTFLEGTTTIAEGAEVGPQARIVDSDVGPDATVQYSVVVGSKIGQDVSVGPFASLRAGTVLERGSKVGTFVETKKSVLGEGSKAPHLSYLGDAEIGRDVNVGAGTITCNWDGVEKHGTVIEDDAYIGSDTMLVAPVHIGKRAATGAGAVVKGEVPDDSLAVGVPARILEGKGDRMNKKPDVDEDPETP